MDEFVEWYFSDANKSVDKDDKKATKDAYDNGKITLDQLKGGSIWKRNKVKQMEPGKITRLNDDFLGYQATIPHKKQAEENVKATKDQPKSGSIWKRVKANPMLDKITRLNDSLDQATIAQKKQAEENAKAEKAEKVKKAEEAKKAEAVKKSQTPKDDSEKQGTTSTTLDATSASKDIQSIMETANNYADVKPTVKVSPFFWKNIDYMLEDAKSAAMKEEASDNTKEEDSDNTKEKDSAKKKEKDSAKKQELLKKLKSQKAELYADHILKTLANLAYSTSNWTGAEAGHNPAHEMTSSQADLYKNIQNQAYANQIGKIKDYDIKQQTDRTDAVNNVFNEYLERQVASKWKAWSNDSRFKDAKGNIDYIKMFDSLDINEKQYLNNIMKSKLASLNENSSIEDAAKAFAAYELGPIATEVLKGAVEATGSGIQRAFNWLKDRL